jgi:hypothetical protein
MFALVETVRTLHAWMATLSPQFAFLLALPFGVAGLGLAADAFSPKAPRRHSSASR